MKKRIALVIIAFILIFPVVIAGCQSGVPTEQYDALNQSYQNALAQIEELNNQVGSLNSQVDADRAAIQAKDDKLAYYESEVANLKDKCNLTGATPQETAEKIVSYYHETHVYSAYDLFVCSDMAAEVWNMLKAAGIDSVIAVGNVDTAVSDILQSNHAWVLAEVQPGKYLALETTGGYSVTASQNILYYRGWSFDSPADLKGYNDLVKEYNVRVGIRNDINDEVNKYANLHNNSSTQAEADKYLEVYNELTKLRNDQETILNNLQTRIYSLAAVIQ
jgi:outer membrane murein-binding lipoprotein Lpp